MKGGPPALGLGEVLRAPYNENVSSFEIFTYRNFGPELILWFDLNNVRGTRDLV
jgi:hypothetical protein